MTQYNKLADIYDYLVAGIDYEEWADYMEKIVARFNSTITCAADLACGTGNTTIPLAARGYEVYGVDLAPEMLKKAIRKAREKHLEVEFLEQDMRRLNLPKPMDLITCYHDGLNYIIDPEDLKEVFRRVYESLKPGGLFIFDLNAVEKLSGAGGGDTTFVDETDMSLIWETFYDHQEDVWEIRLTGFVRKGEFYEKFIETHQEKAYHRAETVSFLEQIGFELLDIYHGFSFDPPRADSRRLFYVARRGLAQ